MINLTKKKIIVGLDIGTTKTSVLIGEISDKNTINIIGIGYCLSNGINKGKIDNLDDITQCIKKSINQAEKMANLHITSVYLSLSTTDISCQNEIGIIPLNNNVVTKDDIKHAIYIAKSVKIKNQHDILHIIPKKYDIDKQRGVIDPIGLSGKRIQANVHLITCHKDVKNNIFAALENCGLNVEKLIFSGLSSSTSVLTTEEKELGVCMLDIGGGIIDMAIYINGVLEHIHVIPYAGDIVTNDIAYAFKVSKIHAEKIKTQYTSNKSKISYNNKNNYISANINYSENNNQEQVKKLMSIIKSRYIELLKLVNHEIRKIQEKLYQRGMDYELKSGIVLTGGASKIDSLVSYGEKIFNMPVRIGIPNTLNGLEAHINNKLYYSTVIGLLHYAKENYIHHEVTINKKKVVGKFLNNIIGFFKK
ncbi:cell division protein FtsA [Buchnera aphidicola (Formosaphis micheliae)]|uniref:cell division protein FtsA n=1 Tax=Buchnera aphidicola TaxID=9 RepID=UPI0031CC51CB